MLLEKVTYAKRPFYEFKKFVSVSSEFTQRSLNFQTFCCNLKIRVVGAKCVWGFYYFHFERNYDVLKSKSLCILLSKNINFNKNKTELKMENPVDSFREMHLVFQLVKELQIKSATVMSCSSRKKKECIFCNVYFVQRTFFFICVLSHV